ncbi:sensor histidine kinase [Thiovibrio frasassiensis]|uniref:histidine kinase n=1 Tax=Thiovibrio frasassiensis TaxID=2984131 RepID=A0A9X4MF31_9BACT|nr:ATP-binding protein [Thiovibrio frasassiensis]MDG4476071.1 ATP-binding protein [Thiovibrio frasassiensis]
MARIKQLARTTGFRLALWYSLIFISSALLLFSLLYFPMRAAIMEKDRNIILAKLNEYVLQEEQSGLQSMLAEIRLEDGQNSQAGFFVRVADPTNQSLIVTLPPEWHQLDSEAFPLFPSGVGADGWILLPAKGREDALEIISRRLQSGYLLQIGRGSRERQKILEYFGRVFAGTMVPLIIFAFGGGVFLAFRSLRPVRDLIQVVRSIDIGKMDARVPSRQTGDELDELVRLFNIMLARIEQLLAGMRAALDNVAHDLRTPVTRLRAGIETALQSDNTAEVLREALLDCAEESERIMTMLNTLMDISEAETGAMKLHRQSIDIVSLLGEVVDLYQYVAEENGVEVSVVGPADLTVSADRDRMRQVVANLLDNSLKHTPRGGRIELSCDRQGEEVVIQVRDSGTGIPPHDLPLIFDRLYRGDHSRSQRGLGLGLSLVKAVIQAHAGRIKVESAPGQGTTFILQLPGESPPQS